MQPFDLEKAKKGVPLLTRGGKEAKFISHIVGIPAPLVIGFKGNPEEKWHDGLDDNTKMENYFLNGRHNMCGESDMDLFLDTL